MALVTILLFNNIFGDSKEFSIAYQQPRDTEKLLVPAVSRFTHYKAGRQNKPIRKWFRFRGTLIEGWHAAFQVSIPPSHKLFIIHKDKNPQ